MLAILTTLVLAGSYVLDSLSMQYKIVADLIMTSGASGLSTLPCCVRLAQSVWLLGYGPDDRALIPR
jgi:hypothetical protein